MNSEELKQQLDKLPQEVPTPRDLWPEIATQLGAQQAPVRAPAARRIAPWAMAAALTVGVGLVSLLGLQGSNAPAIQSSENVVTWSSRAAQPMFMAAAKEVRGQPVNPRLSAQDVEELQIGIQSAEEALDTLETALKAQPKAAYLWELWRDVNRQRLSLMRTLYGGDVPVDTTSEERSITL